MMRMGIIGGSGVYGLDEPGVAREIEIETPFGSPSGPVLAGSIGETEVFFLPRHGAGHRFSPSTVPYRANIYALKSLGVTHLVSLSAVGSLQDELPPRSLVVPEQIVDRTVSRERTFFDSGIVAHVGIADPYCPMLRDALTRGAQLAGHAVQAGGVYVCIEGPQFSTRAESNLYRSWGASVIGMTAMPEARLAREAQLCYAALAMVTDYDVWHESEADVSVDVVMEHMQANGAAAGRILRAVAEQGLPERHCTCGSAMEHALMTDLAHAPTESLAKVSLLLGDETDAR